MKSASTIRTCSLIMMLVTIIATFVGGVVLLIRDEDLVLLSFAIWTVGIFGALMQNALFQGFADIIDNTYASACAANGIQVSVTTEKGSGHASFQQLSDDRKSNYADDLLSKGLISQEDYDEMTK